MKFRHFLEIFLVFVLECKKVRRSYLFLNALCIQCHSWYCHFQGCLSLHIWMLCIVQLPLLLLHLLMNEEAFLFSLRRSTLSFPPFLAYFSNSKSIFRLLLQLGFSRDELALMLGLKPLQLNRPSPCLKITKNVLICPKRFLLAKSFSNTVNTTEVKPVVRQRIAITKPWWISSVFKA